MSGRVAAERNPFGAPIANEGYNAVASSTAWRVTVAIVSIYAAAALLLIPVAHVPGPHLSGIIPFFVAGLVVTGMATSFLLFVQLREMWSWSILLLGCAYLYSALMSLAQLATFPGAMLAGGPLLPVSQQAAAWIFVAWNSGFALLVVTAVCLEAWFPRVSVDPQSFRRVVAIALGAVASAVALVATAAAYRGDEMPLIVEGRFTTLATIWRWLAIALLCLSIWLILFVIRARSRLYLWLSLALTALVFHNILAGVGGGRFTVGWTVGRLSWLVSAFILFIYFLQQFSRQQRVIARAEGLLAHAPEAPKDYRRESHDPVHELERRLDSFVTRENIKRYKEMLESQPGEVHRQVITTLLAEEETRLHQASAGRVH